MLLACFCVAAPPDLLAGDSVTSSTTEPAATQPADAAVTVAILDFDAKMPGDAELGKKIHELLGAALSGEPGIQLVERASMDRILQEHQLNLTGEVDAATAIRVGKLVGARLIVKGRAFLLDKEIFITTSVIGTETGKLAGTLVEGPDNAGLAGLLLQLSQKTAEIIRTRGPTLLPNNQEIDPLPALKTKLAGRRLPRVCVNIKERHLIPAVVIPIDPAVETEVKSVLISVGFTVTNSHTEAEMDKAGVDIAVSVEAFSELNANIGNLVSCSGHAELNATARKGQRVIFAGHTTARAVDLAENIAGKTSLQKAGHELAIQLLEHLVDSMPPVAATQPAQQPQAQ
jgi:hypothetical protein